jgi:hypothetical protein
LPSTVPSEGHGDGHGEFYGPDIALKIKETSISSYNPKDLKPKVLSAAEQLELEKIIGKGSIHISS